MEQIQLKTTQVSFSRIVYGAWRLSEDRDISANHILKKIELCLEQGIDTFDHADIYGDYECEKLFGRALSKSSEIKKQIKNVSKCDIKLISNKFPERRCKHYDTSSEYIQKSLDQTLKNLGVDVLDLLLIHRPDPLMGPDETASALDEAIAAGKVKAVGVSNFSPYDFDLLQSRMKNDLVVNQIEISVLCRDSFLDGTLSHIQTKRIVPMAWSPLAGGRLFGSDEDAIRVRQVLEVKAQEYGTGLDSIAMAWLIRHPAGIIPVAGTNRLDRIQNLGKALEIQMSREEWFEIWIAAAGKQVP